ncbi:hypothetical protein LQV63_06515 [Paenibacillus profundus]|uniref:Uncharacterized protein n=1 Tax=Paenibacillus profundus TaxID=1173085 RepID=A0ABS8YF36_9BACL|nr:hypothetical protein [Paenibacillus profundus]MCE5168960.1 hypothetical protein [Paenibacillus profundus]
MAFQKPLPEWKKQGIRPPESKITEGYNVMDKPPAAWMNWHMNTTYEALEELQNNAVSKEDITQVIADKTSIVVTSSPPPVPERKKGTFYWCISDLAPLPPADGTIKVSPTMGIKLK